ncbi:MAG TPA: Maf family protein [Acidobacteriaceae bacterium]
MSELPSRLILASSSPRRRELLTQAGYTFTVEAADVDESVSPGESPADYVRRLAEEKAQAVFARHAESSGAPSMTASSSWVGSNDLSLIVLGADTTVMLDGEILAKPADASDAKRMLRRLSGRTHEVLTGVAAATRAGVVSAVESTSVTFSEIPEVELDFYCATHEPMDKAGAYGIQGYAARWIPRIDGDYFNVMGLPIARVVRLIEAAVPGNSTYRTE